MGTKRHIAPLVREVVYDLAPRGHVVDLFSGMGAVARSLAPRFPVVTNDLLKFTTCFARAQFTPQRTAPAETLGRRLHEPFVVTRKRLRSAFKARIAAEAEALESGRAAFADYLARASHVGNDRAYAARAVRAQAASTDARYRLVTLYFSAGYFGTAQAIELDAIRAAIDQAGFPDERDWLLAAWIAAAAAVINSPGHTAQFLQPSTADSFKRIRRQWRRSVWPVFLERLDGLQPAGDTRWRQRNLVTNMEAGALLLSSGIPMGLVYADPPYTKDQYSRYYHVYETMYAYDYPDSNGVGRYRTDRFVTDFCRRTQVAKALETLFDRVADRGIPLTLSYPSNGLACQAGFDPLRSPQQRSSKVRVITVESSHSTLGGSNGSARKFALENLYVAQP